VNKKVKFEELFDHYDRTYFIVTFMAILVLAKDKEVEIIQNGLFEDIYIEGKL
ncbi:MAG TPA: segregation/condensation protein A, partial [Candidatus Erysipelatoclostridium merdavium]|nr:segregation/condensation protein A [Candidatus Erysipelatoclostridium merdavium]